MPTSQISKKSQTKNHFLNLTATIMAHKRKQVVRELVLSVINQGEVCISAIDYFCFNYSCSLTSLEWPQSS